MEVISSIGYLSNEMIIEISLILAFFIFGMSVVKRVTK